MKKSFFDGPVSMRYLNYEPISKLWWCRARNLFGSQIPVTTEGFQQRIYYIRSSYLTHQIHSSDPPVVTGICDPNKSRGRHHRSFEIIFSTGWPALKHFNQLSILTYIYLVFCYNLHHLSKTFHCLSVWKFLLGRI